MSSFRFMILWVFLSFFACSSEPLAVVEEITDEQKAFMMALNEIRSVGAICGAADMIPVDDVIWSPTLASIALQHARDMSENEFFSHTGSNGSSIGVRAKENDYNYSNIGENIAWGYTNAMDALEGWLESPSHCTSMLNGDFVEIGLAQENEYWVLVLGRQL